jgi:hypothetical protein
MALSMAIQLECPGCKNVLHVDDSLAGKAGKCIHCGQRIVVPGGSGKPAADPIETPLYEASPEAMVRELGTRGHSAVLFLFRPTDEGSYDISDLPASELKCIGTEDINSARFSQWIASVVKKFGARKRAPGSGSSIIAGASSAVISPDQMLYELKGDRLGMSLEEFKQKYSRSSEDGREKLPLCSDEAWGANKASLHVAPWHVQAGIIHARIDLPSENNPPTVAGVKTDLLLYHFVDGQLFRISASFPTDLFHLVSEAAIKKYGPVTSESQRPRQLVWENPLASVMLTRGNVHPPQPSTLIVMHKELAQIAESRAVKGASDI